MAIHQKRSWLIGYDITNPRRLNRIRRRIIKDAVPVQYSLYLFHGSPREIQHLLDALAELMDTREDDLRAYPMPKHPEITTIGQSGLPSDIILADQALGDLLGLIRCH